ncbi:MAG: cystathionine beta-lyase [Janthinobacterium lividum]
MTEKELNAAGEDAGGGADAARGLHTELLHPSVPVPPGFAAFPVPVARGSTVLFANVAELNAYDSGNHEQWRYGLQGTPTSAALCQRLALIEGGTRTLLQPSGLSAISNVYFAFVEQGDDVLVPMNAYGPTLDHARWMAKSYGITVRVYDPMLGAGIAALMQPNTRLLWVEAPGSVTMEVPDIGALSRAARAASQALQTDADVNTRPLIVAIDNTYSAGLAFKPFEHDCDVSVQALTKYQSGASDVLMGATITRDDVVFARLKRARMLLGLGVSADDCSLLLRSLPSMAIRHAAHDRSALALAHWLERRAEVAVVLHPALPECPGHENFVRDFSAAGGLFSVVFDARYTSVQVDAFVDGLKLFKIGFSWGGANSLALPYDVPSMRPPGSWPHRGTLVRFYVGLEDEADLRADIAASMARHLPAA